jgi:hypothetical protein
MKLLEWMFFTDVNLTTLSPETRRQIRETLRRVKNNKPATTLELDNLQRTLVSALPGMDPRLILPVVKDNTPLQFFPYSMELPEVFDGYSLFYKMLIYNECLGIYNRFINESRKMGPNGWQLAEMLLSNIENLAYNASERICRSSLPSPVNCYNLQDFVLVTGQKLVTILYFSIQELYANQLPYPLDPHGD